MSKGYKNIYFIGIGGIGMSALARYFSDRGCSVAGYDKVQTPLTLELEESQMAIHYTDEPDLIPETHKDPEHTLVVFTPAIPDSHREWAFFREANFTIKKRAEVLGDITRDSYCFAIAGTHGKTTTSSILAHLLKETGLPFTAFLGGISEDFGSNYVNEGDTYTVVEADEFDRSFLHLAPDVACITSIDPDHLDIYGSEDALVESYKDFTKCLKPSGKLLVRKGIPIRGYTYGIDDTSDYSISDIEVIDGSYRFNIQTPAGLVEGVEFPKPGRHNLLNGLVAFAMADQVTESKNKLAEAMGTFKGVARRFSYRIRENDFVFIDDYAHHPTEIDAVYDAIREVHPQKNIMAVFQPHLYSRTRDFAAEFAKSLSQFDAVLLMEIYPAREEAIPGISSEWLLNMINNPNKKLVPKQDLIHEIKALKPEVLVTMGAGDIGMEIEQIERELTYAN